MRTHHVLCRAALPLVAFLVALTPGVVAAAEEGEVVIVLSEEPDIIDPCEASRSNVGRIVKQNVTETLTEIDPDDGSITPRLATEWEQVDDLTWRFKLKEGVTFHDGEPFNAETAKTAIERTLDERIDCEIRIKFFGGMEVTPVAVDELHARHQDRRARADPADDDGHDDDHLAQHGRWASARATRSAPAPTASSAGRPAPASCSSASPTTGASSPRSRR